MGKERQRKVIDNEWSVERKTKKEYYGLINESVEDEHFSASILLCPNYLLSNRKT